METPTTHKHDQEDATKTKHFIQAKPLGYKTSGHKHSATHEDSPLATKKKPNHTSQHKHLTHTTEDKTNLDENTNTTKHEMTHWRIGWIDGKHKDHQGSYFLVREEPSPLAASLA